MGLPVLQADMGMTARSDLFHYFYDLGNEYRNGGFEKFQRSWDRLSSFSFNAREMAIIFCKLGAHIKSFKKTDLEHEIGKIEHYIVSNLNRWERPARNLMSEFSAGDLARIRGVYARLGISPSPDWRKAWEDCSIKRISGFTLRDVDESLWALAVSGRCPPPQLLAAYEERIRNLSMRRQAKDIESQFTRSGPDFFWSYAVLNSLGARTENIARVFHSVLQGQPLTPRQNKRFTESCLWLDLDSGRPVSGENNVVSSRREIKLMQAFHKAGFPVQQGFDISPLGHETGVLLLNKDRPGVLIKVDMSLNLIFHSHARGGAYADYNGTALFHSRLINKFAPGVVLLRMKSWIADTILSLGHSRQGNVLEELGQDAFSETPGKTCKVAQSSESFDILSIWPPGNELT